MILSSELRVMSSRVCKALIRYYIGCKIAYLATYLIWVNLKVKRSHVADGIILFQIKDLYRMFARLLFHCYIKNNKTELDILVGLLASYFEGTESKATGEL